MTANLDMTNIYVANTGQHGAKYIKYTCAICPGFLQHLTTSHNLNSFVLLLNVKVVSLIISGVALRSWKNFTLHGARLEQLARLDRKSEGQVL